MALKKRRATESSGISKKYNSSVFISAAAEEHFVKTTLSQSLIKERGMQHFTFSDETHHAIIKDRNWYEFVKKPNAAITNIVREFYTNAKFIDEDIMTVRGRRVSYNIDAEDEYEYLTHEQFDVEQMTQRLCNGLVVWEMGHKDQLKHFKAKKLKPECRNWLHFICARMMPCTHVSDITYDRVVLMFVILEGIPIDVGKMINEGIKKAIEGGYHDGLPWLHLITALCAKSGEQWEPTEEFLQPKYESCPRPLSIYQCVRRLEEYITLSIEHDVSWRAASHEWFKLIAKKLNIPGDEFPMFPPPPPNPFNAHLHGLGASDGTEMNDEGVPLAHGEGASALRARDERKDA
ncbi:hypothetical protein CDL12_14745 [Handroanthus impetiginosus]|uniref:Putative plant transposon protein domain-containing protein n=1 Tax=Handroanthus impetiginosus TaxID=429701 RepID=A0A2G9H553_9LAMI|nr:hypothetical protein CDL12_14745 [Handroanthus impetiginosus]